MSFEIKWDSITEPAFLETLKDSFNKKLVETHKMPWIQNLRIEKLQLASDMPPELSIETLEDLQPPFNLNLASQGHNSNDESFEENMQITLRTIYKSNVNIKIAGELVVNYPAPMFATLPFRVTIKTIQLNGRVIIARAGKHCTMISIVRDKDSEFDFDLDSEIGDTSKHGIKNKIF